MSIHVCLYISTFVPGGAERQIVNLAAELWRRDVQVTLLHTQKDLRDAHYLQALRESDVRLVNVMSPDFLKEGVRLAKKNADFFRHIPAPRAVKIGIHFLTGAFSLLRPDIVHSYLDFTNCTAGCGAVLADVPAHLASLHSLDPITAHQGRADLIYQLYKYLLAHARPNFEACSKAGVQHYARWLGIAPEAIAYTPNGIDPSVYLSSASQTNNAVRQALHIPESAPILLSLSRFVWEKAPESLPDIFTRVLAARPDCHFLIAGTGMSEDDQMGELFRKCGMTDQVHLLGVRSDVAALFASADIFLLPSRVESFPISIMEAMAAGVPVVASNVGGIPDLVRHGQDGFLHAPSDLDGMAQSIVTLLADAGLRERFSASGRQRILEEFSLKRLGDRVLQRYKALLDETSRTRH